MKKKILSIVSLMTLIAFLVAPVLADETRYSYDYNFPYGTFSLANFRSSLRGLHQMDLMPLRPIAKYEVDPMEYSADAAAQAEYSGTGVTITADSSNEEKGDYSLKAVTDGTADRTFGRAFSGMDLSVFPYLTLWERSSQASDTYQFYIEDSGGDASYWDITSDGSAGTWTQHTFDLSSPDSNSGADADLSDVAEYGFRLLTASKTYYFDQIFALCGMNIVVKGTDLGSYYKNVYVGNQPIEVDAQVSPTLTAPTSNPRIDILTIDSSGTLAWVEGTEASSPSVPWSSVAVNKIPIALVYCKTTMTKVLDYADKDTDTDQGYIYADVRPFVKLGVTTFLGLTDTPSSFTANYYAKVNAGGTAVEWAALSQAFLGLSDTPSSYSGQGGKLVKVNSGATGLEFISSPMPTGAVMPFAGGTAPTGWLFCNGQAVSRSTYSDLFSVISTTYGVGDGSTTFNVPDLRGRTVIALDNLGGSSANVATDAAADSLGGKDGHETHTLTTGEMPAHTHDITVYALSGSGGTFVMKQTQNGGAATISGAALTSGSGGAHNNMQPYIAMTYIIKY